MWQLLLGVLPTYTTSTEWVWRERVEQFRESERALAVTKKITKDTERNKRITIVWLMENNKLKVSYMKVQCFKVIVYKLNKLY